MQIHEEENLIPDFYLTHSKETTLWSRVQNNEHPACRPIWEHRDQHPKIGFLDFFSKNWKIKSKDFKSFLVKTSRFHSVNLQPCMAFQGPEIVHTSQRRKLLCKNFLDLTSRVFIFKFNLVLCRKRSYFWLPSLYIKLVVV